MRKWWSSGIFFMPHPTTLGACRDNRWLLKQIRLCGILCLITGKPQLPRKQNVKLNIQTASSAMTTSCWPRRAVLKDILKFCLFGVGTHQQFTSSYDRPFVSLCVVGVWGSGCKRKREHQEGPHFLVGNYRFKCFWQDYYQQYVSLFYSVRFEDGQVHGAFTQGSFTHLSWMLYLFFSIF